MSGTKYAYAVARIRALETRLLSQAVIEQLMSVKTYDGCLRFLAEQGWGDGDTPTDAEALLACEREKAWEIVRDLLKDDRRLLSVLSYGALYHTL